MPNQSQNQTSAGETAQTPTLDQLKKLFDRHNNKYYAMAADDYKEHASEASVNRHYDESIVAEKAFLDGLEKLANSHASLLAQNAALVAALNKLEADAVNLHCAIQSTAHMDPNDSRIPVITGQVVKDLLAMRDSARAALAQANQPQP